MSDPNVTEWVPFTGDDGRVARLRGDYGRLVVDGGAELSGETAADFICEAAAILLKARKREALRLADEAVDAAEAEE